MCARVSVCVGFLFVIYGPFSSILLFIYKSRYVCGSWFCNGWLRFFLRRVVLSILFFIFTPPAAYCSGPFSFIPHLRAHSSYKRWTHKRIITIRIKNKPLSPNDKITAKLFVLLPVTKIKTYIRPFIHQSFDFKILTTSFYCLKRKKVAIQISKSSSAFQASYFYQKYTKRMSALPISYGSLPGNFKIKAFTLCVFKWKIRSENTLNKKIDWPTCISLLDFLFLTIPCAELCSQNVAKCVCPLMELFQFN